jgi:hypothetical protein
VTTSSPLIRTVRRALAVLALLIVAVHALTPATTPVERVAGSPFSVATYDVAIGGTGQVEIGDDAHLGDGPDPRSDYAMAGSLASSPVAGTKFAYRSYRQSHRDPPAIPIWSRGPPSV